MSWPGWVWLLVAAAVLAIAFMLLGHRPTPTLVAPRNETETVRGTELQLISPAGATELLREFTWQSPVRADRYRVIVRRGATVVWQAETSQLLLALPPTGTIERDVQYEWQVEAVDREGNVRLTSPPQSFVVY